MYHWGHFLVCFDFLISFVYTHFLFLLSLAKLSLSTKNYVVRLKYQKILEGRRRERLCKLKITLIKSIEL